MAAIGDQNFWFAGQPSGTLDSVANQQFWFAGQPAGTVTGASITPISLVDSVAGSDSETISATLSLTDSVAGSDSISVAVGIPLSDSVAGSDALSYISLTLSDSISGSDSIFVAVSIPLTDSVAGSDSLFVATSFLLTEPVAGSDSESITVAVPLVDFISGSDAFSTAVAVPLTDSVAGSDSASTVVSIAFADSVAGSNSITVSASIPISDSFASSDLVSVAASIPISDSASGSDSVLTVVSIAFSDSVSGSDSLAFVSVLLSDSVSGSDSVSVSSSAHLSDSAAASDSLGISASLPLTDVVSGSDVVTVSASFTLSDSASGTDSDSIAASLLLPDSTVTSDSVSVSATLLLLDFAFASDSILVSSAIPLSDSVSASESIQVVIPFTDSVVAHDSVAIFRDLVFGFAKPIFPRIKVALPPDFPCFRQVLIFNPAESVLNIRWSLWPTNYDLDKITFEIFRSNSPTGPWDYLGSVSGGRFEYTDYKAPGAFTIRTFYYIVRISTDAYYRDSKPTILTHDPDPIAQEMIRKKNLSLVVKNGIPLAVLLKKTWGPKCSRCWHSERLAATDADCPECFGTGYSGGYMNPVYLPGSVNLPEKMVANAQISYEPANIYAEISNHPIAEEGMVVVDQRLNVRYRVGEVNQTTHRGYVISQILTLTRLDTNSIVNTIPVKEQITVRPNSPRQSSGKELPAFRNVSVFAPAESVLNIQWSLEPTSRTDLEFQIFRSNSPTGPWDLIGTAPSGRFEYMDYKAPGAFLIRTYYYVVRIATSEGYQDSDPVILEHDPDPIAMELIRKKTLSLTVKNGVALAVLLKKSWGAKCSRCWSDERLAATDADCPECFGTGYPGGYMNPVLIAGIMNPVKKTIVEAGIVFMPGNIYAELANHPVLNEGDVIVDRRLNVRYVIDDVKETSRRGFTISQIVTLLRLDQNSIVNTINVPEAANFSFSRSYEMVTQS